MIRYILVDDEPPTLKKVQEQIVSISKDYDLHHVKSYDSSRKAFEEITEDDFDLLIVDFEMPVYNGLELAKKVATNKKVIFLTSTINNEKKVINSLDISGFLSKPFELEEFEEILKNKVIGKVNRNKTIIKGKRLTIAIGVNKDIGFYPDDTYYISSSRNVNKYHANKNCVHFFGAKDEVIVTNARVKIHELSKKLVPYGFEKINQSTIVNLSKINERNNRELSLLNCQQEFTIGENEKQTIITKIRNLLGV